MAEERILGIGSRIEHEKSGPGVVVGHSPIGYKVSFIRHGVLDVRFDEPITVLAVEPPATDLVSMAEVERRLIGILNRFSDLHAPAELGDRWKGGTMLLQPADKSLKAKEVPIEQFFHKIVMMRDRLRTLEQRVNASKLDDEDKVNIQQYITRIYGSMTTFNIFFKHPKDQFTGAKGD